MSSNKKICVIAANNSITDGKVIDYIQLASVAAERVKYFLGLDTYIITNDPTLASQFSIFAKIIEYKPTKISKRVMVSSDDTIQYDWFNDSRIAAFELTKGLADKVLMLDADYIVGSDQLSPWLKNDCPFSIFNHASDVIGKDTYQGFKYFPSNDILQRWATGICFDHSEEARVIFDTANMVRENYEFYALMTGLPSTVYRNDLAFSVACHLHNIPYNDPPTLFNVPATSEIYYTNKDANWIIVNGMRGIIWDYDMHVLNKKYAIDPQCMNQLRLKNVTA